MSKFNTTTITTRSYSALRTSEKPSGTTFEGHPGYNRDAKSALFLLAVSNFVGENTFYEKADDRDARYRELVRQATLLDPSWTAAFLKWLRTDGNMRSASLVGAAEYVRTCLWKQETEKASDLPLWANSDGKWALEKDRTPGMTPVPRGRQVIASVLQRDDEPGEMLGYWLSRYGRAIPKPVKRGVADAVLRMTTERGFLKWDSDSKGIRLADVINLTHPGDQGGSGQEFKGQWQKDLLGYIVKSAYQPDLDIPVSLDMLRRRKELMAVPVDERRGVLSPERLRGAGMTWESLAGWLQGPMDAQAWEAVIPSMGIMALIRNLRNFDQAGISDAVADEICAKISNPEVVAKSRQLPFRWYSAYKNVASDRWRVALGKALDLATGNIPALSGRTLILVDTSASMAGMGFSARSTMRPVDAAALFGVALGQRCGPANIDLHGFATGVFCHPLQSGGSVMRQLEAFANRLGEVGHGTNTAPALKATYNSHDRVVILTDEQAFRSQIWYYKGVQTEMGDLVPAHVPIYAFNFNGYEKGMLPDKTNRYQLGGLTDHSFKMIPLLESGYNGKWPWEENA